MKTAFVTGGTGFVGAHLARALLSEGVAVRAFLRRGSDLYNLSGLDVEVVEGDLLEPSSFSRALHGCDACFHLAAAYAHPDPAELYRINVEGTRSVLCAAEGAAVSAFVHGSTIGTLGRSRGGLVREDDLFLSSAPSDYVRSKYEGERVAERAAGSGMPVIIAHIAAPVGAGDRRPTVTGRRIVDVLRGRMPRYPEGAINHIPVKDVARGLFLAARSGRPGAHYLLALRDGNLTRREFIRRVAGAGGVRPPRRGRRETLLGILRILRRRTRGSEPPSLACDPTRSIEELGLPQSPLDPAFREAVEWFHAQGIA